MASQVDELGVMGGKCGCGSKPENSKQVCPSNPGKKRAVKPENEKKDSEDRGPRDSDES